MQILTFRGCVSYCRCLSRHNDSERLGDDLEYDCILYCHYVIWLSNLAAACLIGKVKKKCWKKVEKNLTLDLQIGHYKPFGMSPTLCQSLLTFLLWVFFFFLPPLAFLAPLPRKGWTFFKSAPLWCQKGHSGSTDILLVPLPQRS